MAHPKFVPALALAIVASAVDTRAAVPETGMYWDPRENGKGTYIELQGNIVFVTTYAYHLDGTPVFYVGSNVIQPDSSGPPDFTLIQPFGLYPVPTVALDLYEVNGGKCLACDGGGYDPPQKKGFMQIWWVNSAQPTVEIVLDGQHHQPFELQRLNYGIATIGTEGPYKRAPDVRGEWVFVEVTDPLGLPWRFNFDQREDPSTSTPLQVVFRDSARNAEFRCGDFEGKQPGCELRQNGTVIFSAAIQDVGLSRMQAYRGDLLPRTGTIGRRPESVIGYRVN